MPLKTDPDLGINSWLEDELYQQYLNDRTAVDESWKHVFEDAPNGQTELAPSPALPLARSAATPGALENLQPLRGIAAKIAENMNASVSIPLATSQRVIPVKVMDENRRIINQHRTLVGKSKVSYTHLIGWAILKALEDFPGLNHAYGEANGQPARIVHPRINLGIAVDVDFEEMVKSSGQSQDTIDRRLTFHVPVKAGAHSVAIAFLKRADSLDDHALEPFERTTI